MAKLKQGLIKQIKEEQAMRQKQDHLRAKYRTDENVMIVEKSNTFKFLIRTLIKVVQLLITVVLISFAAVGVIALIYEGPRHEIILVFQEVAQQFGFTM